MTDQIKKSEKEDKRKLMEPLLNRKARHDYAVLDSFQAGIVLEGWEVKAILARKVSLEGAHIIIKQGEMFLFNANISPLISTSSHNPIDLTKSRKLLMKKKEIMRLMGQVKEKGLTLIPMKLYQAPGRKIKVEVALAKGKKEFDKRQSSRDADVKKELSRLMKHNLKNV